MHTNSRSDFSKATRWACLNPETWKRKQEAQMNQVTNFDAIRFVFSLTHFLKNVKKNLASFFWNLLSEFVFITIRLWKITKMMCLNSRELVSTEKWIRYVNDGNFCFQKTMSCKTILEDNYETAIATKFIDVFCHCFPLFLEEANTWKQPFPKTLCRPANEKQCEVWNGSML